LIKTGTFYFKMIITCQLILKLYSKDNVYHIRNQYHYYLNLIPFD